MCLPCWVHAVRGQSSMGEALLLEAVCISSSDMTDAVSLEPADKLPPFSPLPRSISQSMCLNCTSFHISTYQQRGIVHVSFHLTQNNRVECTPLLFLFLLKRSFVLLSWCGMNLTIPFALTLIIHANVLYIMQWHWFSSLFNATRAEERLCWHSSCSLTLARLLKTFWSLTSALFCSV